MARYVWEGRSRAGGDERGVVDAPTRDAALKEVRSRGMLVTRLEESPAPEAEPTHLPSAPEVSPPPVARRPADHS